MRGLLERRRKRRAAGLPESMRGVIAQNPDKFWCKVDKTGDCWLWTGSQNTGLYGQVGRVLNGKKTMILAHRYAYFLTIGEIPAGHDVRHTCLIRLCCNPAHLFLRRPKAEVNRPEPVMTKKRTRNAFRKAVFGRDRFQCVVCGGRPGIDELDPHHITDRNEMTNGGYIAENGITLCKECHIKAEQFHATGQAVEGYSPDDLYNLIGSSKGEAIDADDRGV